MALQRDITGAIGLSMTKSNGLWGYFGKAVRFFTGGPWNHAFVVANVNSFFGATIIEASERGTGISVLSKYFSSEYDFQLWMPQTDKATRLSALEYTKILIGKKYGYLQCVGFIPMWLIKKITLQNVNNPFGSGVICSELVLKYIQALALNPAYNKLDRNSFSPNDLYRLMKYSTDFKPITPVI